ncbi:hypothetical protein DB30_05446 [Enhygromyxa salina]|uniref:Uncharacterized protein n=1 Tax=Enhygromyxa salina TaxID=215803 RepID=A0A0C2D6A4_9BACT|nr:hypothetical protein [Enhygromyxa salina]KIG15572.1 hypothetical protein DB30_05446 [Enhygromyxa salina]
MQAFADAAQQRFEAQQVARLLAADATLDEAPMRQLVSRVVRNALAWGIDEEQDVEALIDWARVEGPDFHLLEGREELRELLEDPQIAGFAKVDVLREDLFEPKGQANG